MGISVHAGQEFWTKRWLLALIVVASTLPLLLPAIPPLIDLPGHIGSYKIEVDGGHSAFLARYFDFHWNLVGNLGVDMLVLPMAKLLGLEPAVKLIVMSIPPLTVAGMLITAREIHGRVPPTAFFALPLAYGYPFQFGFVNFALSMALMFLGIGVWLRLGRLDRRGLRAVFFVPFGFVLFLVHCVGWAMFGLALGMIELVSARQRGAGWGGTVWQAAIACLPLAASVLMMANWLLYRSGGVMAQLWDWPQKAFYAGAVLHNSSAWFDLASAAVIYGLVWAGREVRFGRYDPRLAAAALALLGLFIMTPGIMMGAFFADMRMAAYILAVAALAVRPAAIKPRTRNALAVAGLCFLAVRLGVQTWTYIDVDRGYQRHFAAIDHIPQGARVYTLSGTDCGQGWGGPRTEHLGTIAIARREAFVNGQWPMPGGRLLSVHYPAAGVYALDPSETAYLPSCHPAPADGVAGMLRGLPRAAFGYVWLVSIPENLWPRDRRLQPVWRTADGVLYRVRP